MVLAIIGAVLAAIQMIVAASGASTVKIRYGSYFDYSDCKACREVCRFKHRKDLQLSIYALL